MGAAGKPVRMVFENAAGAAYPDGWKDYRCVASYDRQNWFRIAGTRYEDGSLSSSTRPSATASTTPTSSPIRTSATSTCSRASSSRPTPRARNLGSDGRGRDIDLVAVGREAPGLAGVDHRPPAPRRDHGWSGSSRACSSASSTTPIRSRVHARENAVLHRAEHEPGRRGTR